MSNETITPEQIAAYQRQLQAQEQQAMRECVEFLVTEAANRGFEIVAIPAIRADGRIVANWGVKRK